MEDPALHLPLLSSDLGHQNLTLIIGHHFGLDLDGLHSIDPLSRRSHLVDQVVARLTGHREQQFDHGTASPLAASSFQVSEFADGTTEQWINHCTQGVGEGIIEGHGFTHPGSV